EISESEQSLDERTYKELVDHIVEVETDAFIRAVLYKDAETMDGDKLRAADYLQGTKDLKLTYAPDPTQSSLFTAYTNSDFFGDKSNGKSTNGYL
ncbi:hypothetical protein FRC01_010069, partial [Tulasnella sp. 417]